MKRLLIFVLLAAVLRMSGLLPFQSSDVAQLTPVQTLTVSMKNGQVILDGEDCKGIGADWESALMDLHQGAEGQIFLETADQVVFAASAVTLLPEVAASGQLRPAAAVCVSSGEAPDPERVTKYLSAHDTGVTIQDLQAAILRQELLLIPVLEETEGGLRIRGSKDR